MENENVENFLQAKIDKARKAYVTANGEGVMAFIHQGEALADMQNGFEGAGRGKEGFNQAVKNDPALPPKTTAYKLIDIFLGADKFSPVGEFLPNSLSTLHAMLKYSKEDIQAKVDSGEWDNKTTRDTVQGIKRKQVTTSAANDAPAANTEPPKQTVSTPTEQIGSGLDLPVNETDWDAILSSVGIESQNLEQIASDMTHPQYMIAHRVVSNKELLRKGMAPLKKAENKKVMKAVLSFVQHEQEVFDAEVMAQMPNYNKELQAKLKKELAEQKKVTTAAKKLLKTGFEKKDFRKIRGVLHSDRAVDEAKRDEAFNLFLKLEPLFK